MNLLFRFSNWFCDKFGDRQQLLADSFSANINKYKINVVTDEARPPDRVYAIGKRDDRMDYALAQCAVDLAYDRYGPVDDKLKK